MTDMSAMFQLCKELEEVGNLSKWDTSNVTNMMALFNNCLKVSYVGNISNWNTSKVTSMKGMFLHCYKFEKLGDMGKWDVSNVTDMSVMFRFTNAFQDSDLSKWDTSKVTTMANMFNYYTNAYLTVDGVRDEGINPEAYKKAGYPIIESISIPPIPKNCVTTDFLRRQKFLKNITSCGKISSSINLYYENYKRECPWMLTRESLLKLFNALDPEVQGTITLSPWNKEKLTEADYLIATNKGWTVV